MLIQALIILGMAVICIIGFAVVALVVAMIILEIWEETHVSHKSK